MKAVLMRAHGGLDALQMGELPTPEPKAREVRVRVKAVALNHLDLWVLKGWKGLKLELPHILGSDVAGVVDAVGSEVKDLALGTEVCVSPGLSCGHCRECLLGHDPLCPEYAILGEHCRGGYAEFVVVPRQNILPKPKNLDFVEATSILLTFLTANQMLVHRAQLRPGETVLVHAAGSGVGAAGVQIAKLLGARVIATAGSDAKLEKAKALGADEVVNYQRQDFVEEVKRLTGRKGVEVVFEHVGGEVFEKSIYALARGGRLVTCGSTAGAEAKLDLRQLFYRSISLLGSTMGSKGDLFDLLQLAERGLLKPVVDRILPLSELKQALTLLEDRAQFGKIVLVP